MGLTRNQVMGGLSLGAGVTALSMNPAGVGTSIGAISGVASGVASSVTKVLGLSAGTFGTYAPFAAPLAGAYLGHKVMNWAKVDSNLARGIGIGSGALIGAATIATTGAAPLIIVGGSVLGFNLAKGLHNKIFKKS